MSRPRPSRPRDRGPLARRRGGHVVRTRSDAARILASSLTGHGGRLVVVAPGHEDEVARRLSLIAGRWVGYLDVGPHVLEVRVGSDLAAVAARGHTTAVVAVSRGVPTALLTSALGIPVDDDDALVVYGQADDDPPTRPALLAAALDQLYPASHNRRTA